MILETERLVLRKITQNDYEEMKEILQDEKLMLLGWGKIYSDNEIQEWIERINKQYEEFGYSYYLAVEKSINRSIGLMGILPINIKNEEYIEIAYILKKEFWGQGYVIEGMKRCVDYIFVTLNIDKCIGQVVPENVKSIRVLEQLGMKIKDSYIRKVNEKEKLHLVYERTK